MVAAIRHRGPDGCGSLRVHGFEMSAARLGIIDPDSGAQIITSEDGKIAVAFNGEIYNHRQLRVELEARGHVFATKTDTEVIVHLYEEVSIDCVHRLRGMFAFAVFDGEHLVLARDRLGIKPLYYSFLPSSQVFVFASEIKAILQCPQIRPSFDLQALADSVVLGHAVGTRTFIKEVQSLAPGHTLTLSLAAGELVVGTPRRYCIRDLQRDDSMSLAEAQAELEQVLAESIELHLDADVEVGTTLSGGLDSTMLALLASRFHRRPLLTFTLADHEDHPDLHEAAVVAKNIRSEHFPIVINFDEYLSAIPSFIAAEEQPSSLYGMPFHLLCKRICQRLKACLHGEGADELFGGYREYLDRQHRIGAIRRQLPKLKRLGLAPSDEAATIIEDLSRAVTFDEYLEAIFALNLADPLERLHLDLVDKSSMAASVEMRVPYLDDRVFDFASRLPLRLLVRPDLGIRKYILRRLCLDRFGLDLFDVALREKLGVPAAGVHFISQFDRLCDRLLPEDYLDSHELGFLFETKRRLLTFELFNEIFIDHRGDASSVGSILDYVGRSAAAPIDVELLSS